METRDCPWCDAPFRFEPCDMSSDVQIYTCESCRNKVQVSVIYDYEVTRATTEQPREMPGER